MGKPNDASVTDQPCTCGYLQNAADDAGNPIVSDEQTGEYQFTYHERGLDGPSMLILYHCPFCGGAAPKSKRSLLSATIPRAEESRLAELLAPVRSIDQALSFIRNSLTMTVSATQRLPGGEGQAPTVEYRREIHYEDLSEVATVWITEQADGTVLCRLQGKYTGN